MSQDRPNSDHVIMGEQGALLCRHCGQRYVLNMPCPIAVFAAACEAYAKLHAACPPPTTQPAP